MWENFVGTPFDDDSTVHVRPLADTPRRLNGGPGNDRIVIQLGDITFVDDGATVTFPGTNLGAISYENFEIVEIVTRDNPISGTVTIDNGSVVFVNGYFFSRSKVLQFNAVQLISLFF